MVYELIEVGVDVNVKYKDLLFIVVCCEGYLEVVELLINVNVDINLECEFVILVGVVYE